MRLTNSNRGKYGELKLDVTDTKQTIEAVSNRVFLPFFFAFYPINFWRVRDSAREAGQQVPACGRLASPPFAYGATGFGMTTKKRQASAQLEISLTLSKKEEERSKAKGSDAAPILCREI